jgi:hypothetical protein
MALEAMRAGLDGPSRTIILDPVEEPQRQPRTEPEPVPERVPDAPEREREPDEVPA